MPESTDHKYEERMKDRLKLVYKPAAAAPQFKEGLRKRLAQEAQEQASRQPKVALPRWLIWAPAVAALALFLAIIIVPLITPATGTLEISVPETSIGSQPSPGRTISEINLNVNKVTVQKAGKGMSDDGTWITVLDKPQIFNLLDRSGVHELVASIKVPAGEYTQIRMQTGQGNARVDGEELPLEVADELKIVHPFSVGADVVTALTISFDIHEEGSIVDKGHVIALDPVLKLEVTQKD